MEDAAKRGHNLVIGESKSGQYLKYFKNWGVRLLEVYDDIKGIKWTWQ